MKQKKISDLKWMISMGFIKIIIWNGFRHLKGLI